MIEMVATTRRRKQEMESMLYPRLIMFRPMVTVNALVSPKEAVVEVFYGVVEDAVEVADEAVDTVFPVESVIARDEN